MSTKCKVVPTIEYEVKPEINKISTTKFNFKIENFSTRKKQELIKLSFKVPGITTCHLEVHPDFQTSSFYSFYTKLVFKVDDPIVKDNKPRHIRFVVQTVFEDHVWSDHFDYTHAIEKGNDKFINQDFAFRLLDGGALKLKGVVTVKESDWNMVEEPAIAEGTVNRLVEDIQALASKGALSDFKFLVGGREFEVHKAILAARSPVFERMFSGCFREAKDSVQEIEEIEADVFKHFLSFCYAGRLESANFPAQELILVADRYQMPDLVRLCEIELLRNLNSKNAMEIFFLVSHIPCYTQLKETAFKLLQSMFNETFTLPDDCVDSPARVRQAFDLKHQLAMAVCREPVRRRLTRKK